MKMLLTVAINDYHGAPLRGCLSDSLNISSLLYSKGFEVIHLHNSQATRNNIVDKLKEIVTKLQPNDHFIFHYSGHGSQLPCVSNDEIDSLTEILCPFDLINEDGSWNIENVITDDELRSIFDLANKQSLIEMFADSCHSGTITKELTYMHHPKFVQCPDTKEVTVPVKSFNAVSGNNVICWSGCLDSQTSADAYIDRHFQGAFTASLMSVGLDKPREEVIRLVQQYMIASGYSQTPQLNTSNSERLLQPII